MTHACDALTDAGFTTHPVVHISANNDGWFGYIVFSGGHMDSEKLRELLNLCDSIGAKINLIDRQDEQGQIRVWPGKGD